MSMRTVLHEADISRALTRIAHEILESNRGAENLVLLGIPTRGVTLAHRLGLLISEIAQQSVPVGSLDVTLFRDDLAKHPTRSPQPTEIPVGGIDGKTVVLVDDVLFSGRSIRAALDAIQSIGRPAVVRLAILVDAGTVSFRSGRTSRQEHPLRPHRAGQRTPPRERRGRRGDDGE